MEKTLYLECEAGASGDMIVAALLDLGASRDKLEKALASLPLEGYRVVVSRVEKSGLSVCDFDVQLDEPYENHDHDMDYLYGEAPDDDGGHHHGHGAGHHHGHHHSHHCDHNHGGHGGHVHRGLPEIEAIIDGGQLTPGANALAKKVFGILADAEAAAHGCPRDQVHFHEVGAVDSIVDIVAAAVCLDDLGTRDVVVQRVAEGRGTVRCQHGIIPVPVPATTYILRQAAIPTKQLPVEGELVTPTGAAVLAAVRTRGCLPDEYQIEAVGMGAGKRAYPTSGILRAFFIAPMA